VLNLLTMAAPPRGRGHDTSSQPLTINTTTTPDFPPSSLNSSSESLPLLSNMGTSSEEPRGDFAAKIGNVTVASDDEARQATDREHSLSLMEAVKLYPTAVGWSIYFSLGVSDNCDTFGSLWKWRLSES
jgi:hypothetical protein